MPDGNEGAQRSCQCIGALTIARIIALTVGLTSVHAAVRSASSGEGDMHSSGGGQLAGLWGEDEGAWKLDSGFVPAVPEGLPSPQSNARSWVAALAGSVSVPFGDPWGEVPVPKGGAAFAAALSLAVGMPLDTMCELGPCDV